MPLHKTPKGLDGSVPEHRIRRAFQIETLPDDLAALIESGLDKLRVAEDIPDDGDTIVR
jgi:hypothetical protein